MKAVVGKKYKLIAAPPMFKAWIGTVFIVSNITKTTVDLKQDIDSEYGYGSAYIAVSQDEFSDYFEIVQDVQKPKKLCKAGKWSEWKTFKLYGVTYAYKENGKDVVVRSGGHRGRSKCHPEDQFDLEYGLRMAISRLIQNKQNEAKKQEEYKKAKLARDEWWFL